MTDTYTTAVAHPDAPMYTAQPFDGHVRALNPVEASELGAVAVEAGFTAADARDLVGTIQQAAAQTGMVLAPKVLEMMRKINDKRLHMLELEVRALPNRLGHVDRDQVLLAIQRVRNRPASL